MKADLKPCAEYKESGLSLLGCAAAFLWKRSQNHNELTGAPHNRESKAA
jgi:hypothetical protein